MVWRYMLTKYHGAAIAQVGKITKLMPCIGLGKGLVRAIRSQ